MAPPLRMSRLTTRYHPQSSDTGAAGHPAYRSFGWARATGPDGATAEAWLQTGESYAFTAAASHWPAMTAGRPAASTPTSDSVVTGFVTGPVMTPAVAARGAGAPPARRTSQLATGPPITPPS